VTPGKIDLKVVEDRLGIVRDSVAALGRLPRATLEEFLSDERTAAAAESHLRRAIEALFDTARHLLSKGFGLGALEYRDVERRAHERGLVADPGLAARFEQMAGYRNRLIHFYEAVTAKELFGILRDDLHNVVSLVATFRNAAKRLVQKQ
jgi:uncharacterized protein YutE (UPF0331/DUF86 family)